MQYYYGGRNLPTASRWQIERPEGNGFHAIGGKSPLACIRADDLLLP